jgi:hypothetical protein
VPLTWPEPTPEQLSDKKTAILHHASCLKHLVPAWHQEKPERIIWIMDAMHSLAAEYPGNIYLTEEFNPISK